MPLSLLLYLDPLVTINNALKYLISCQTCRSAGQDALRGEAHSGGYICVLLSPPKKNPEDKVLLTFKI